MPEELPSDMGSWMSRRLLLIAGILVQVLLAEPAGACVAVYDEQGRLSTPVVDPGGSMFVGRLVGLRVPDRREIQQLRAMWDNSPARRAVSDEYVIEAFSSGTRLAEFEIQKENRTAETSTRTLWFATSDNCQGPFNEGLPLEVGQIAVVFSKMVDGVPTGWIPNMISVEQTGAQDLLATMKRLFDQSDRCPQSSQPSAQHNVPTIYLRAPKSGFGRGCVAELH